MSKPSEHNDSNAYLVIRRGGRWTDVFRLVPGSPVVIGRSSHCQIVIRSDQCSRAHAEIAHHPSGWVIRDRDSRNGTLVNGEAIAKPRPLHEGDVVLIAGVQMTFGHRVAEAFAQDGPVAPPARDEDGSRTQEQIDPALITLRRGRSAILEPSELGLATSCDASLLRTAFQLARSESSERAAEIALDALRQVTGASSGAVLVQQGKREAKDLPPSVTQLTPLATISRSGHSYRRLSDRLTAAVWENGEAILARNIEDDLTLASPDSQGQLSTTSALCAPIRMANQIVGLLHVYSTDSEEELTADHLELALAIAANLAVALEHHWRERQLRSHLKRSERQLAQLREQLADQVQLIGESDSILEIQRQVTRAAPTDATVLVRGESGVGKELIAAAIHYASPRRKGPFVCLNCAALSPSLLESELFGHEKGAFTGATERKIGKFEAADAGTLMLDEIGEMSPEIQAKFLRVLEGQAFERVGGNNAIRVDVRVVAATNRDLEEAVRAGSFRSDLYFRLHVLELRVPPLRQRGRDILLLAEHFLARFKEKTGRKLDGLTGAAKEKLLAYHWPGNIRELKNTIERAVVLCPGPLVEADDLLLSDLLLPGQSVRGSGGLIDSVESTKQSSAVTDASAATHAVKGWASEPSGEPLTLAQLEREHIERVLEHTDGNKSQAARLLGIERSTLDRKLKRFESE